MMRYETSGRNTRHEPAMAQMPGNINQTLSAFAAAHPGRATFDNRRLTLTAVRSSPSIFLRILTFCLLAAPIVGPLSAFKVGLTNPWDILVLSVLTAVGFGFCFGVYGWLRSVRISRSSVVAFDLGDAMFYRTTKGRLQPFAPIDAITEVTTVEQRHSGFGNQFKNGVACQAVFGHIPRQNSVTVYIASTQQEADEVATIVNSIRAAVRPLGRRHHDPTLGGPGFHG